MRFIGSILAAIVLASCATQSRTAHFAPRPSAPVVQEARETHEVETRYEIRGYRDAEDPSVRHAAHAIYRTTRVPVNTAMLETVPRNEFAPASYAPLPRSAELSAELAMQKQISDELRTIRAKMAAVEAQAQRQYGTLVEQTTDTVKLREQLETERARLAALETKIAEHTAASSAAVRSADKVAPAVSDW